MAYEEIPEKEGLIIILSEKQEGVLTHDNKEKEFKTRGEIIIVNNTGSPIYDLELKLSGIEKTDLEKKVTVGFVPARETGKEPKRVPYNIRDVPRAVDLNENLIFPEDITQPVTLMNEEIDLTVRFNIKNSTDAEMVVDFDKEMPTQIIAKEIPSLPSGTLNVEAGRLSLREYRILPRDSKAIEVKSLIIAEKPDAFRSGKITYRYFGEGITISGLGIEEVTGTLNVRHHVDKSERSEQRGVWDNYVIIENLSRASIKVVAEIGVISGKILTPEEGGAEIRGSIEWRIPGRRDYDTIVMEPVIVGPGETTRIGPFTLQSDEEPKVSTNLRIWIIPEIIKRVSGEFLIEDIEIPVIWGRITKEVSVEHPSYIMGMTDKQLVGHLEESVNVTIKVDNLGSATVDHVIIRDVIPADFKPPRIADIKISLIKGGGEITVPPEMIRISLEPQDPDPSREHRLTIEIFGIAYYLGESLLRGEGVVINYKMIAADPKPHKTYELPAEADLAVTPDIRPLRIKLEEVPTLETLEAIRKIAKSKEVLPGEVEGEYIVIVTLRNEGDLPVRNYEHIEQLPPTFEFITERATPAPETVEEIIEGLSIKWLIQEIRAREEFKIQFVVRGKPGHKVSDLLRIVE